MFLSLSSSFRLWVLGSLVASPLRILSNIAFCTLWRSPFTLVISALVPLSTDSGVETLPVIRAAVVGNKVVLSRLASSCMSCLSLSCRGGVVDPLLGVDLVAGDDVVVCSILINLCSSSLSCVISCWELVVPVAGLVVVTRDTGRRVVGRDDVVVVGWNVVELLLIVDVTGDVIIEVNKEDDVIVLEVSEVDVRFPDK